MRPAASIRAADFSNMFAVSRNLYARALPQQRFAMDGIKKGGTLFGKKIVQYFFLPAPDIGGTDINACTVTNRFTRGNTGSVKWMLR